MTIQKTLPITRNAPDIYQKQFIWTDNYYSIPHNNQAVRVMPGYARHPAIAIMELLSH